MHTATQILQSTKKKKKKKKKKKTTLTADLTNDAKRHNINTLIRVDSSSQFGHERRR